MKTQWTFAPSPKDSKHYTILLKNSIGDTWESDAIAFPTSANGWSKGRWQDHAKEVIAYRPFVNN